MGSTNLYQLAVDEELRVEVDCPKDECCVVELMSGRAEIFGTELVVETLYKFTNGAKFAIFTYHGCQVTVKGNLEVSPYTSKETPMVMYANLHAALEQSRSEAEAKRQEAEARVQAAEKKRLEAEQAHDDVAIKRHIQERQTHEKEKREARGPTVLVVGPTDVGKSTLCRLLLNYAVRMGRTPLFADLDVGQVRY